TRYNSQTSGLNERDIYVVKLDSLGNLSTGINSLTATIVHDVIHIRSTINFAATEITLYDAQGRKIIKSPLTPKGGNSISIENLGAGIYFYEIKDAKGKAERGKLVKE
ncbi:MAG: T9SS type A sorting domain-containing protein, partial [Bacteroidia bacterium]